MGDHATPRRGARSPDRTYAPDATHCVVGHRFKSEQDCVLPEGWDYFMCKRCLIDAGLLR